jgi:hypothetical protein
MVPEEMELLFSYRDSCTYEWSTIATTTREDPRPYVPDVCNKEFAVSVFRDRLGNFAYIEIPLSTYSSMDGKNGVLQNPEKEELLTLFEVFIEPVEGAIAFNSGRNGGFSTGSSLTFTASTSDPDAGIIVMSYANDVSDTCRQATYNGVTMNYVHETSQSGGGGRTERIALFQNIATTTGTFNVVITCTGSISNEVQGFYEAYTGVNQTTMLDNYKGNQGSATTSVSVSATTSVSDVWAVTGTRNDAGNVTSGTNNTIRIGTSIAMGDSAASLGSPGTYSVTSTGPSGLMMMISLFIRPATDAVQTLIQKTFLEGEMSIQGDITIQ